jgi:methionyl-tRNA formyltransferase
MWTPSGSNESLILPALSVTVRLSSYTAAVAPAATPGTVIVATPGGIDVATGDGALRLLDVQLEGKRRLDAAAFLAGHRLPPGTCLGG